AEEHASAPDSRRRVHVAAGGDPPQLAAARREGDERPSVARGDEHATAGDRGRPVHGASGGDGEANTTRVGRERDEPAAVVPEVDAAFSDGRAGGDLAAV